MIPLYQFHRNEESIGASAVSASCLHGLPGRKHNGSIFVRVNQVNEILEIFQ